MVAGGFLAEIWPLWSSLAHPTCKRTSRSRTTGIWRLSQTRNELKGSQSVEIQLAKEKTN
jgi:hypothetical protein